LSDHFLECYGFPITDTRALRSKDFTTLISAELHTGNLHNGETWHVLAVGLPLDFSPPQPQEGIVDLAKRAFDAGAYIGLVHPAWYGLAPEDARILPFAHAVEIYNHGSEMENDRGDGWSLCNMLLNEGARLHGFATDDAHHMAHDAFGGWIHVKADGLDAGLLLESLKAGRYYSSQGPIFENIECVGDEILVECSPVNAVMVTGRGSRAEKLLGKDLTSARLPLARFSDTFFRVTVVDNAGKKAWSNPVWLNGQ
tara:strand:+ start:134 stop:898 length:765 start_codon:yes stop_codon:yes gene_type:complete